MFSKGGVSHRARRHAAPHTYHCADPAPRWLRCRAAAKAKAAEEEALRQADAAAKIAAAQAEADKALAEAKAARAAADALAKQQDDAQRAGTPYGATLQQAPPLKAAPAAGGISGVQMPQMPKMPDMPAVDVDKLMDGAKAAVNAGALFLPLLSSEGWPKGARRSPFGLEHNRVAAQQGVALNRCREAHRQHARERAGAMQWTAAQCCISISTNTSSSRPPEGSRPSRCWRIFPLTPPPPTSPLQAARSPRWWAHWAWRWRRPWASQSPATPPPPPRQVAWSGLGACAALQACCGSQR